MKIASVGDLALSIQQRRQNTTLKVELDRLSREMSTGISDDLNGKFKGNFNPLSGIERGLSLSASFLTGIAERRLETSTAQRSLTEMKNLGEISNALLAVQDTADPVLVRNAGQDAEGRFSSALAFLNTQSAGRSVFSGIDTDQPAVADAETILTDIEAEVTLAGATTAAGVSQVVSDWFAVGGSFDTVGYLGGPQAANGYQLSSGEVAAGSPTAQDQNIRDFLAGMATASLVGRNILAPDNVEQGKLARLSGELLIAADSKLVDLQARVGIAENQIARAEVEVRAEAEALDRAKSELIGVDPFETAVRLENAETQLQTLYAVTARLSGLSLANFL